jgi:hypothetical protein
MQPDQQVLDLHESLATALARIEIQRLRVRRLTFENVQLRNVLRNNGIEVGEGTEFPVDSEGTEYAADEEANCGRAQARTGNSKEALKSIESHDVFDATILAEGAQVWLRLLAELHKTNHLHHVRHEEPSEFERE